MAVLFVAALAFFLASFPARNSDLWRHLAAGRQVTQGNFRFGLDASDPGAAGNSTTWLYDLLSYLVYSAAGGTGLVFVKALLVAGTAVLMLLLSRAGQSWWLAAACTAVAVLAMGTRLLLQPATFSYLFLALSVWMVGGMGSLDRPPNPRGASSRAWLPPWPLLVLFALWANLDSGFVVGLAVVASLWVGQALDESKAGGGLIVRLAQRASAVALTAAACLINPAVWSAFVLPPDVAGFTSISGGAAVNSPFQGAYLTGVGLSPAGLAYFPLLVLGVLSFLLDLPRFSWRRFLPFVGLALLSSVRVRAVPFFAVVAGPVLAWNFYEAYVLRLRPGGRPTGVWRDLLALRPLGWILAWALLVCAWPGWLQAPPYGPRRWAVETPPSLQRGAEATRKWYQEGKLGPDARGLHLSAESANAFAWFCPEDEGLLDPGLSATLLDAPGAVTNWDERLRAAGVNHVIVYDPDVSRLSRALTRLLADPEHSPLLYVEGSLAVFGWRDPARPSSAALFRGREWEPDRLAFHARPGQRAGSSANDGARFLWEAFWRPAPRPSLDRDEAKLYLLIADTLLRWSPWDHKVAWEAGEGAGLAAAAAGWSAPGALLDGRLRLALLEPVVRNEPGKKVTALDRAALRCRQWHDLQRDDIPPALLYLAIRAARRALAADPDDFRTLVVLGECYQRLSHNTRERAWVRRLPQLAELRRTQASWAFNQALALRPNLEQAHLSLGWLYKELGYLDLAVHHLRAHQQLVHKAGPPPGVTAEQAREAEARNEEELSRLAADVEDRESTYTAESPRLREVDRADLALRKGLAGKARDLLLESDRSSFGRPGMVLELQLLLRTGRARDVRTWTEPEQKDEVGPELYHWLRAQALAALGDYAAAEGELSQLNAAGRTKEGTGFRELAALVVGEAVLDQRPPTSLAQLAWRAKRRVDFRGRIAGLGGSMRQEADATVVRGLLALEEGQVEEAASVFRTALSYWRDAATAASGGGVDFASRPIAQEALRWLTR